MKKKYIFITLILILLDQITKLLVISKFNVFDKIILIKDFLKFEYVQNTGISFGLFSGNTIIIILLSLLIICYMIYNLIKSNSNIQNISCILIISGALGNLIDRIFRGYVVDFISFTLFNKEMAIFNVADMFITFGIIIYIIVIFMEGKNE